MTEREMKQIIGNFIANSLKKVVLPTTMGVGLALAMTGCGDVEDEAGNTQGAVTDESKADGFTAKYMGPFPTTKKCYVGSTDVQVNVGGNCTTTFTVTPDPSPYPVALYSAVMAKPQECKGTWQVIKSIPPAVPAYMAPIDDSAEEATYSSTNICACYCEEMVNDDIDQDNTNNDNHDDIAPLYAASFPEVK